MQFETEIFEETSPLPDGSLEDSLSLGEIMEQDSTNIGISSGAAEEVVPPPEPEGFLGGLFSRGKKVVQQDDQDIVDNIDVSQQPSLTSMGESGQMSTSLTNESSRNLAGAYISQSKSTR